jgi:xylulokinase
VWNPIATVVEPDSATRSVYDELYARYRELYGATADIAHHLAARQT